MAPWPWQSESCSENLWSFLVWWFGWENSIGAHGLPWYEAKRLLCCQLVDSYRDGVREIMAEKGCRKLRCAMPSHLALQITAPSFLFIWMPLSETFGLYCRSAGLLWPIPTKVDLDVLPMESCRWHLPSVGRQNDMVIVRSFQTTDEGASPLVGRWEMATEQ